MMDGMEETQDTKAPGGAPRRTDLSSIRDLPPPAPRPERVIRVELLPYDQRTGVSAHDRLLAAKAHRPTLAQTIGKTLLGFLVVAALLVGLFFLLRAIEDDSTPTAPWAEQNAPLVSPAPLDKQ
jgi:predicted secreted protein